jgi:hypothetical protein
VAVSPSLCVCVCVVRVSLCVCVRCIGRSTGQDLRNPSGGGKKL